MKESNQDLTIKARNTRDLLTAPEADPFSDYDYIQSGEAALSRAIRYINSHKYKAITHLNIYLPNEAAKQTNETELRDSIHHYLHFQLKENAGNLAIFKRKEYRIFRNATFFLLLCMAIVTLIGTETFLPNLPPLFRTVLVEGFTVIGWVVMWRPVELFLNEWTSLKIENNMYQQLLKAKVQLIKT